MEQPRKLRIRNGLTAITPVLTLVFAMSAAGQNQPCKIDLETLQFAGSPIEQARCLLRPNGIGGVLGPIPQSLPKPLSNLIGRNVSVTKINVRKYLRKKGIAEDDLGGSLEVPLSSAITPRGTEVQALYFVIHDTSTPYLKDDPFPNDMDENPDWRGNKIDVWVNNPVAHIFVNRLGRSVTTTMFNQSVKKGWGTKFARDYLKADAKGLQIHIELVQPRRRDPNSSAPQNDRIAPTPGFTDHQYERLALLYLCASVRRGTWMIPAYHSAIDAGIRDAHDDPQNFDLSKFSKALRELIDNVD